MYREEHLKALLEGRRILLAGYGREGKSSERLVRQLLPNADITIVEGNDNIKVEAAKGYDLILKSPGIPTFVFEGLCDLNTITSQTDLFLQVYGSQTIGVTGTKGKSTTTNLIADLLRSKFPQTIMAGNMGIPLFDIIPQIEEDTPVVCEFSCHQLENIHRAPHIGVLLNLFQEHLDHYHSYRDYQLAKLQIGLKQQKDDVFYYCTDNEELRQLVTELKPEMKGTILPYGIGMPLAQELSHCERKLQGEHNLSNIAVAYMVAEQMGLEREEILDVVARFNGLEHRMELVGTYHDITFYNDSISTIPAACIAAVEALKNVNSLILGGFDRGIDYSILGRYLAEHTIQNLVFVGAAGLRIKEEMMKILGNNSCASNVLVESDYTKIIPWIFAHTQPGTICLLSPAAASYDAFKNFEERGRVYKDLVRGQ